MLMVVDVGNTNVVGGIYRDGRLGETFRLQTVAKKTEDEYGTLVRSILVDKHIDPKAIELTVLSSVVPSLTMAARKMIRYLTDRDPVIVGPDLYPRLPLKVLNPHEIGPDLVANAMAAWLAFRGPCVVVDFGTALTFTSVAGDGEIAGVSIVPGLTTAVTSLSRETAQLPFVELADPGSALGKNTVTAIQSGIVYGYVGLVEYLVMKIKKELGPGTKVVATGGLHRVISPLTHVFDLVDPDLTLNGLEAISRYA